MAAPPESGAASDALTDDIDRRLAEVRRATAPQVQLGAGARTRSGSQGLDRLVQTTVPIEAVFHPGGNGTLKLQAQPTLLLAGATDAGSADLFGTNLLRPVSARAAEQSAAGLGLNASYRTRWVTADIGVTPLGFARTNAVGGVELAPSLGRNLRLRATGERRAVTDSLLSFAGAEDPASGVQWGGVVRNRGHVQLEWSPGFADFYAGGGGSLLQGTRVADNTAFEAGAGASFPVYRSATREIRAGLDLVAFGYERNLRFFTLGHGGYFSPQSYAAALVPVSFRHQVSGRFSYGVGGSLGFQAYRERSSPVFPTIPELRSLLSYQGRSESGVIGSASANAEYDVLANLRLGARAAFQRVGNFTDATGSLYARLTFDGPP